MLQRFEDVWYGVVLYEMGFMGILLRDLLIGRKSH